MPALIRFVGASSRGGFSMNASTRPSSSVGTTPNIDGSSTGVRSIVPSAPESRWNFHERVDVEVGEHVAVDHEERVVDAGVERGEADRAGGVERLGLDRVVQPHPGAHLVGVRLDERVGPVPERQHRVVDAVPAEVADDPLDHRPIDDRQHLLRGGERSAAAGGCRSRRRGRPPSRTGGRRGVAR